MNLLFLARSIFSQIFYPVVFFVWLTITFKRNKHNSVAGDVFFVAFILLLLALIYLPSMIAAENFPSYRTLFPFTLAVFLLVSESLMSLFTKERGRNLFTWAMTVWLALTGIYTFNFQYINPLKKEYRVLRNFVRKNYKPHIQQVYFIRADKFLFTPEFHTRVYRDEFGAPSTYRDWVPEPIIKQMVFEITKNRQVAQRISVTQFETAEQFEQTKMALNDSNLLINMNRLFKENESNH